MLGGFFGFAGCYGWPVIISPGPHDWCAFAKLFRFDRLPRPPRQLGSARDGFAPPLRPPGQRARVAPAPDTMTANAPTNK